jgi:hypothetical protein
MGGSEPRQIGSYEVLAKLADGGVGTVYLARRGGPAAFRRLLAIKRLHPQFASDPGFVTMFTDEARLAARIHHANVVSIVELGADDDGYYVVMEYVDGSNLGHFHWHATRGDRKMPRAVALKIVLDALSGLHAAHEIEGDDGATVNLVHRDVSPQNIILGMDGLARLGDFGIAKASALRAFETRGPALKGKLEYMAPEQIECKAIDRTTDLFAMGIQRVCFDPIPSPRAVDPSISLELERICLRALERVRAKRYPTAAVFAEDLERAARADAGIATQREVAACMTAVLGNEMPVGRAALLQLSRGAAPAAVADLAGGIRGKAATYQLPASDPMIILSPSAKVAASAAHPPISGDVSKTEPFGEVPSYPGSGAPSGIPSSGIPSSGIPSSGPSSGIPGSGISSAPPSHGALTSTRPAIASRSAGLAVLVVGCFVLAGLVAVGGVLLVQSRAPRQELRVAADAGSPEP